MQNLILNTGAKMPILGFGVWQLDDLKICQKATKEAIGATLKNDIEFLRFKKEILNAVNIENPQK